MRVFEPVGVTPHENLPGRDGGGWGGGPVRILLTKTALEALLLPVIGEGEVADLIRRLQEQVQGNMLMISEPDCERLTRYAKEGGDPLRERAAAILEGAVVT